MNRKQETIESDELRGRFTKWLNTLLYRAKWRYIRKEEQSPPIISLEELEEDALFISEYDAFSVNFREDRSTFVFEEKRLAIAFAELSMKRQRILEMLFVEEKKPRQIAKALNCAEQSEAFDDRRGSKMLLNL